MIRVAVLAVQGAFIEHEQVLRELGADPVELRGESDLRGEFDALVLPGGESTVQAKLLREQNMLEPLRERIAAGLPVLATCAGLILLARRIDGAPENRLATLDVTVRRNAYGRQLSSFFRTARFGDLPDVPMPFIRAPRIEAVGPDVEILARHAGSVTAVRQGVQLAMAFHPELTGDPRVHRYFLRLVRREHP